MKFSKYKKIIIFLFIIILLSIAFFFHRINEGMGTYIMRNSLINTDTNSGVMRQIDTDGGFSTNQIGITVTNLNNGNQIISNDNIINNTEPTEYKTGLLPFPINTSQPFQVEDTANLVYSNEDIVSTETVLGQLGQLNNSTNVQNTTPTTSNTTPATKLSYSPYYGVISGPSFKNTCKNGSIITNISGRGGSWVDQIRAKCSDGSTLKSRGSITGADIPLGDCSNGFSGVDITYGNYIGQIKPICEGNPIGEIGAGLSDGAGNNASFRCPGNKKIVGFNGNSDMFVNSLSFACGDYNQPTNT